MVIGKVKYDKATILGKLQQKMKQRRLLKIQRKEAQRSQNSWEKTLTARERVDITRDPSYKPHIDEAKAMVEMQRQKIYDTQKEIENARSSEREKRLLFKRKLRKLSSPEFQERNKAVQEKRLKLLQREGAKSIEELGRDMDRERQEKAIAQKKRLALEEQSKRVMEEREQQTKKQRRLALQRQIRNIRE